ncbi:endonuclease/exonuclease/phosphatase family protein [Oerskovia sp. Sa1BUA8]|uniref:Endonuclease/exonuclease/phosphatase family protein n=1 Tax=Oerskovia douganii TaxID=2762210 RepID=A0A9D5UDS5_9CELL|nr:endonuclease/exonuclease/phosphatase family protein [Oerskovia douganii]MBE7701196.1 endonuclease/exonuclease/phosphatase family protein [Oerskovia douganii]
MTHGAGVPVSGSVVTEERGPSSARRVGGIVWTVVLALCLVGVGALTLARALGLDGVTPLAQLVSATPWVALAALVVLLLSLSRRRWVLSTIAGVLVVAHAVWLVPFFVPGPGTAPGADGTLRVMATNVFYGRADALAVVDAVRAEEVELLSVVELSAEFEAELVAAGIEDLLPYSWTRLHPTEDAAGSGLWSATPLSDERDGVASRFHQPSAVVGLDGTDVRVTAAHPHPPTPGAVDLWAEDLALLREEAHADPTPQILLGDFNATHDHSAFRDLLGGRFADATRLAGDGLNLSWPAGRSHPPLVDLDHVVVDEGMRVGDVGQVEIPGTDHLAILATVQVRP